MSKQLPAKKTVKKKQEINILNKAMKFNRNCKKLEV